MNEIVMQALPIVGGFILLFLIAGLTLRRLWTRAPANRAFVRTGMGGMKVIIDGGAFVVPLVHEIRWVSLEPLTLEVMRKGVDSLITGDPLRADVEATFYVRVNPDDISHVMQAARTLKSIEPARVKALVEDKLVGSLRAVAAKKTLNQLHEDRDGFAEAVKEDLSETLLQNGLTLEDVTIVDLDQTTQEVLKDSNIFDAKAREITAGIVAKATEMRNAKERDAELAIKAKDVATRKAVLLHEQEEELAAAEQNKAIAEKQARLEAETKRIQEEQARLAEEAQIEKEKGVEVANIEREKARELAQRQRQQDIILKEKDVELTKADQLAAEQARVEAEETVKTAQAKEAAMRAKTITEIKAAEDAEKLKIAERGRAEAEAVAAELRAKAIRTEAQAKADAAKMEAEGTKARQAAAGLAEAEASRAKALAEAEGKEAVLKAEANGIQEKAEALAKYNENDAGLLLEQLKIVVESNERIAIETAMAQAEAFRGINMQLYGSEKTLEEVMERFDTGMSYARMMDALNTSPLFQNLTANLQSVMKRLAGDGDSAAAQSNADAPSKTLDEEA